MTNTKFRKRALLSSVAMLLVALVALGSATFAWYQASVSVSATGMNFTTNAASGLLVTTATRAYNDGSDHASATNTQLQAANNAAGYDDTATFGSWGTVLQPASLNPTMNTNMGQFYTTVAEVPDDADRDEDGTITAVNSAGSYYIEEDVYFKIDSAGTTNYGKVYIDGASITSSSTMASAVRVVVYKADGTVAVEFGNTTTDAAKCLTASGETTKTIKALGTSLGNNHVEVCTLNDKTANANYKATVRVYLDGFDSTVTSDAATTIGGTANGVLSSLQVDFSMGDSADVAPNPGP